MRPERAVLAAVDEVFEVWREERTVEATVPVREVVNIPGSFIWGGWR
jgi:hypothetical protein